MSKKETQKMSTQTSKKPLNTGRMPPSTDKYSAAPTQKRGNSITFGQLQFDKNQHLLFVDAKTPSSQFKCSITEDALCQSYHIAPTFEAMKNCFQSHQMEICNALDRKIEAKQWKVPNKEIRLDANDLRSYAK